MKNSKRKRRVKGLVTQSLEMVSREIFRRHSDVITELIGKSPGVYALYDDGELYYVGRATHLRTRVKHHLKDRHLASWTHFSLYLVSHDDHIGEIESLLVRIANPKGNRATPKGRDSRNLLKSLRQLIKQKHAQEWESLISKPRDRQKYDLPRSGQTLKGLVRRRMPLYGTYKGREARAMLTPAGSIIFKGKKYLTPTAAALKVVTRKTVNGWIF